MNDRPHQPVLYKEIIHALQPHDGGRYVDGTLGAGGHARGILEASAPDGQLLGLDVDPQALALARKTLAPYEQRTHLVQASYISLSAQLAQLGWKAVDGIVLDLGVSSMQFDTPERGFSFMNDAPLDMRFGPSMLQSAADLVNEYSERELADLIYRYGEERDSRKIARAIVKARPLHTTRELAAVCRRADILIVAIGRARLITPEYVKPGAAVIDVGNSYLDGKVVGDVDFAAVAPIAGYLSPVPGGVGPMTITMLLRNTVTAARMAAGM